MTGREILVESDGTRLRAALLADGRLEALEIDTGTDASVRVGAVVPAVIARTVHGLGTILALPGGAEALLEGGGDDAAAGDRLIVQLSRPARGGKLGAATRSVALTGRGLVHLPFDDGLRLSRRLDIAAELRDALAAGLAGRQGGWIVRRSAALMTIAALMPEIAALANEGLRLGSPSPALDAPDAFRRLAADFGAPDPRRIVADGRRAEAAVTGWASRFAPHWIERIVREELSGAARGPTLFDRRDLDSAIAALSLPRVALPHGGSLVIERTEALTAIDVNAGAEASALAANLAAAAEIARQLRLRHIGGIVVIDFVSMAKPRQRDRIMAALEAALADDPAQTRVLPMSAFGLVEMTRARRGPGLEL